MNSENKSAFIKTLCIILSVVIVVISVAAGISPVIKGEITDCNAEIQGYNSSVPDESLIYQGLSTKESVKADLDDLDSFLAALIQGYDIEALLYSDETATLITKYSAIFLGEEFSDMKFRQIRKSFPDAYSRLADMQLSGASWEHIDVIPFGITKGDKEAFIKACGAGAEHLGNSLLDIIISEPSAYYQALVPVIESTHNGIMPSFSAFVLETGLSGSKRIEFLIDRILGIIEPIKKSPLTYLCDILPDFIINYNKACELLNSNEAITEKIKLTLPTIDSIVSGCINLLGMTAPPVDYDYLASSGTANVGESGGNDRSRTVINGDREAIFQYLANYITSLFTYENNYPVIEDIFLSKIKNITSEEIRSIIYGTSVNNILSDLLNILARNADSHKDMEAEIKAYNSQSKDYSYLFSTVVTKETASSFLGAIDDMLVAELESADIKSFIYTDKIATIVAKYTALLCGAELSTISFNALKKTFPEAYNYISDKQANGKTWDDIDTIPFGITNGDEEMFVKACGAGAEHFGDVLAICVMVSPTSYDDALVPLLESFHTGAMPVLKDFVAMTGLDGAKRTEMIVEKVLSLMEPLMTSPIAYLCDILPDVINSYSKMSEFLADDPAKTYVGLNFPSLDELLNSLASSFGLTLPETEITEFIYMAKATNDVSGDACGRRMTLHGDREVVFLSLVNYITEFVGKEDNFEKIINVVEDLTDMDLSFIVTAYKRISILSK